MCSALKSRADRANDEAKALEKITGGVGGSAGILSWTFGQQNHDLPSDAQAAFVNLLKHLHTQGLISDGAAAVERGGKMFHLHLQCMLWCPKLASDRHQVNEGCSDLVYNCAGMPRRKSFHCYAEVHFPGTQPYVYWMTMVGCVF